MAYTPGGGGVSDFTGLSDTPGSYTGDGTKVVAVNAGATALEFVAAGGGGGLPNLADNTEILSGRNYRTVVSYFKLVRSVVALTAGTTVTIAHGITGMVQLASVNGVAQRDNGDQVPIVYSSTSATFVVEVRVDNTNIYLTLGSGWTGVNNLLSNPAIIMEYTKA